MSVLAAASVSDGEAFRNGMRRCSDCSRSRCQRVVRQPVSRLLRWCGDFTDGQSTGGSGYSPARELINSLGGGL